MRHPLRAVVSCLLLCLPACRCSSPSAAPDAALSDAELDAGKARVRAFIAAYERWALAHPSGAELSPEELTRAAAELEATTIAHVARRDLLTRDGLVLATPPLHAVDTEKIEAAHALPDGRVRVETRREGTQPAFFEYELVRQGAEWSIDRIDQFVHAKEKATEPLLEPEEEEEPAEGEYADLPGFLRAAFENGRTIGAARVEVQSLGSLTVASGCLAVHDPGSLSFPFRPLERQVRPGEYPVQVSVAVFSDDRREAVLKVTLAPGQRPARYVEAGLVPVDTAQVAIFDCRAVAARSPRERERLFARSIAGRRMGGVALGTEAGQRLVFLHTGWGDGTYPVIWGLSEADEPVELLVELGVLGVRAQTVIDVPVVAGGARQVVQHPLLVERELHAEVVPAGKDVRVTVSYDLKVELLDEAGSALRLSTSSQGEEHRFLHVFEGRSRARVRLTHFGAYGLPRATSDAGR